MTTKYIQDIRKIAKTDEILKKLAKNRPEVDKASIGMKRGVGYSTPFDPCQLIYTTDDGNYTIDGLLAGTAGPKVQDGDYNHCSLVNSITGMRDLDETRTLNLILKPDGEFADLPEVYRYTSQLFIENYTNEIIANGSATTQLMYDTPQEVADAALDYFENNDPSFATHLLEPLEAATVDEAFVEGWNFSTTTPLYTFAIFRSDSMSNPDQYYQDICFGVPANYDYTIQPPGETSSTPLLQYPASDPASAFVLERDAMEMIYWYIYEIEESNTFQLAIDLTATNLWKPNPEESGIYPVKYAQGVSIVRFKFGSGYSRYGMVRPGKDGGFVLFETDETGETATGNAYIYRRTRTLAAVVPVAQMTPYLA
jgi:hypothetical protein